jgi:hypothetical protein
MGNDAGHMRQKLKPILFDDHAGTKKPDGTIETGGVNVGRDGITPPRRAWSSPTLKHWY